jgi:hypothetical protein
MVAIFAPMAHLIKNKISLLVGGRGACLRNIEMRLKASLEALYLRSNPQNDPDGGQRNDGTGGCRGLATLLPQHTLR